MNYVEKTGKTIEEALELALAELQVPPERVDYQVLEEPSKGLFGLIGGRMARIGVKVKPIDPMAVAREFVIQVCEAMGLAIEVDQLTKEDHTVFNIRGEGLGVLIGKHGQTLDALQYLTNLTANRDAEEKVRVILDVEQYRQRRADTLTRLAQRLAGTVKRSGETVVLEPMTPSERKIIHMALQEDWRVSTYSEGEEPFRKVVIALKN
ncbi:RNA-binding cell elongation regulator Jag/EloR [Azotosporobacter soli]|uniref:RNA-binding cell elongation regulator Jag/EloR n=1 Tax=Azotosporobacter soli TaxID=3055040 RepID=UPI0031FE848B